MTKILVDGTLILDVLLDRVPHAEAASAVWRAVELGRADGLISAHVVASLHEAIVRHAGRARARETIDGVLSVFNVAGVDEVVIRAAVAFDLPDLDDAINVAAAQRAKCALIVSRNPRHYRRSPIRILTPEEAHAWLQATAEAPS